MNDRDRTSDEPPADVKLQLRQEAGFGCCRCGRAPYEYHHIVPRGNPPHFRPEDMMVLCAWCHDMATKGAMLEHDQRKYRARPRNIRRGYADGLLMINQDYCAVEVGTVQFVGDGCLVRADNEPLLALELDPEGRLLTSVTLYGKDDSLLALIVNNEWISGDPLPWDLEASFRYLKLRRKRGDIALEIDARVEPIQLRADLWKGGQRISLGPKAVVVRENSSILDLCLVGAQLSIDTTNLDSYQLQPDPRFGRAVLVSWPDVRERIRMGREQWLQLKKAVAISSPHE